MATINYNGMELEEVTEPQIFDPPKTMLVWNNIMDYAIQSEIVAIVERMDGLCAICYDGEIYPHCAILPDTSKLRRATNRELARWLIEGNAQIRHNDSDMVYVGWNYKEFEDDLPCSNNVLVRKWDDIVWHEPTVDYLFGGDDADR